MNRSKSGNVGSGHPRVPFWAHLLLVTGLLLNWFIVLPSAVTPAFAQGTPCVDDGPVGGSYVSRVCITAPTDGATVSGDVTTTITVSSASGQLPVVGSVKLYLNRTNSAANASLAAEFESPYALQIPTTRWVDGEYRLEANVTFKDGYTTTVKAKVILTFANGVASAPASSGSWVPKTSGNSPLNIVAVGDGAGGLSGATQVGNLATAQNPDLFLYLGDVYNSGTYTEFYNYYGPTLGGLNSRTNPVPGNHETGNGLRGYRDYWDMPGQTYYQYDSGGWHFIALDSTAATGVGSPQYTWLANDLATNANTACTLVYFHHPRFGLAADGGAAYMQDVWSLLYYQGVDVVLTGHEHNYQRWSPMDGQGALASNGMTQYIIGTGGHELLGFGSDSRVAYKLKNTDGILSLSLGAGGGSSRFISTGGSIMDQNSFNCTPGPRTDTPSPTPTSTVTPDPTTPMTLGPVADAMVSETNATTNYGTSTSLRSDASPNEVSYLRFNVQGLGAPATKATLRLYTRDGTGDAPAVFVSGNNWTESGAGGVTWTTRPSPTGSALSDLGVVPTGAWIEYDVTNAVAANGEVTFALVSQSSDALAVNSKENATNAPELVIERAVTSTPTVTPTVTETPVTTVPFTSAADARVEERNPTSNFGTDNILQADGGADPDVETYLRFSVTGLTGAPISAKVRLYVPTNTNAGSVNGPALYLSSSNIWSETGITWENRPPRTSTMFGDLGAVNRDTWIEFDVTSAITGNGEYSFVLATDSSDATDNWSKETVNKPQLVITAASTGTPTPAPSPTPVTPTPTATPGTPAATPSPTVTETPVTPVATTPAATALTPVADARVEEKFPTTNFGTQTSLRADSSPNEMSYLRFNVQGLSGAPTTATLRLWVRDGTVNAPGVAGSGDTAWSETGITWSNKPAYGAIVSDLGAVTTGTWIEYDVTSLVSGNGLVTLVLVPQSNDALSVESRQTSTNPSMAPQLVITGTGGGTSTPTPTPVTPTVTATTPATVAPSPSATVIPGPTPSSSTIAPAADARVALSAPAANFGSTTTLLADTSPQESSYLRFDIPSTSGTITSATLRLWVVDATSNGPALALSPDTTWNEATITWNTKPAVGATVADIGSIKANSWVQYDVTSAIGGPGPITFVLVGQSSNGADFGSRESTNPPQLVINGTGAASQTQTQANSVDVAARSALPKTVVSPTPDTTPTPAATPTLTPASQPTTAPTETPRVVTGTVAGTGGANLRCRATPSVDGDVIAELPEGSQVVIRGPQEGDWLPAVCDARDGYVSAQFILLATPTDEAGTNPGATGTSTVVPNPPSEAVVTAPTGEQAQVVEPTATSTPEPTPVPIVNGWQDDPAVPWWWTTDQDLATTWSGYVNDAVDGTEFGFDLGSIVPVSHLHWRPTRPMQGTVEIQLSNDGVNWYRLRTVELPREVTDEWADIPVHTQARFINLVFTNPFGAGQVGSIAEIEVWAETTGIAQPIEALTLIVPTPVPTEVPPPTEVPVEPAPTDVPPEPVLIPAEVPVVEPTVVPPPDSAPLDPAALPTEETIPNGG